MRLSNLSRKDIIYRSIQVPPRKALSPLRYSPHKTQQTQDDAAKLKPSTSCDSYQRLLLLPNRHKLSLNRSTSLQSHAAQGADFVPARAKQFNQMVSKKRSLLRIKHKIKGGSDSIPNILEIRESVKKQEASFIRRMDAKLNTSGHANLLVNLKRDLRIKSHNYLREICQKNRKKIGNMKKQCHFQHLSSMEDYVILQCNPSCQRSFQ